MEEKIFDDQHQAGFLNLNWAAAVDLIGLNPLPAQLSDRAADFSCFGGGGSKLSSCSSREDSAEKPRQPAAARKRKAAAEKGKTKSEEGKGKRSKSEESGGEKTAEEQPKQDYIHVRARRGQATDSHSLAERVRREKISQRMKFLQDLVPGCNKVTGKALMLDEIINYVQSLQRQVEFLSMKLATVNPRLDFTMENVFTKMTQPVYTSSEGCPPATFQFGAADLQSSGGTNCLPGFSEASSVIPTLWEEDLHSVVQMGSLSSQNFHNDGTHVTIRF